MSTTDISVGDTFEKEFTTCPICEKQRLSGGEIRQYGTGVLGREVECLNCGAEFYEEWVIAETEVEYLPEN